MHISYFRFHISRDVILNRISHVSMHCGHTRTTWARAGCRGGGRGEEGGRRAPRTIWAIPIFNRVLLVGDEQKAPLHPLFAFKPRAYLRYEHAAAYKTGRICCRPPTVAAGACIDKVCWGADSQQGRQRHFIVRLQVFQHQRPALLCGANSIKALPSPVLPRPQQEPAIPTSHRSVQPHVSIHEAACHRTREER